MSAHRDTMTPERLEAALLRAKEQVAAAISKGLSWQEAFNQGTLAVSALAVSLVERFDFREREALREWGPANWRDAKPIIRPNTTIDHDRATIIGDALERLSRTGFECLGDAAQFIGGDATAQQFSEVITSDEDAWTLAKRAINTARINHRNRKQRERDHSTRLGDGIGFVPDDSTNTEQDALWEMAARVLTDTERALCSWLAQGQSLRDIESGTGVDRRELARMRRSIGEKLRAAGVDPESSSWRPQLPYHPTFNPGGSIRERPKKTADEQAMQSGGSIYDDQDRVAQQAQWARNRTLDRDARRRRPATEAELLECRDAMAAVDARVGNSDVGTAHERVARGALVEHRDLLAKIERERGIKTRGQHASAERDKGDDA